jgi:hypothetical protein
LKYLRRAHKASRPTQKDLHRKLRKPSTLSTKIARKLSSSPRHSFWLTRRGKYTYVRPDSRLQRPFRTVVKRRRIRSSNRLKSRTAFNYTLVWTANDSQHLQTRTNIASWTSFRILGGLNYFERPTLGNATLVELVNFVNPYRQILPFHPMLHTLFDEHSTNIEFLKKTSTNLSLISNSHLAATPW